MIDNDARASALAELWYGNHDLKLSNFVFLAVGPGIGTGIVVDKKLIHGASHAAGEFGHTTLFEGGELCSCGSYGCWEAYASDRATVKRCMMQKQIEPSTSRQVMLQDIQVIIDGAMQRMKKRPTDLKTEHFFKCRCRFIRWAFLNPLDIFFEYKTVPFAGPQFSACDRGLV